MKARNLCSGVTLNVQRKSEWIRAIQRHKVRSEIFREISEILQRLTKHGQRSLISAKKKAVRRITHLEGTEWKISPKSYRIRFKEILMAAIHGQNDPGVLPCVFLWTRTRHTPDFLVVKKLRAEAKSKGYNSHAGSYRITTGPWRILCRIHTWKTVFRLWVFRIPERDLNFVLLVPLLVQEGGLCP